MSDAIGELVRQVMASTEHYRVHEEEVRVTAGPHVVVVDIDDHPQAPERGVFVDVHAFKVGFTEAAADRDGFVAAMNTALAQAQGEFCAIDKERWSAGPSYIEIGGWVGSQEVALRLIALGAHHGLWSASIPESIGIDDQAADALFGRGFCFAAPNGTSW
jgi:hypothetical protein